MSDDREIVCSRVVFVDSEFDAKKGQGEPSRLACLYLRDRDRPTRPRDGAPPCGTVSRRDRHGSAAIHFSPIGFALSAEAGSFLHVGMAVPAAGDRPLCRIHGDAQHRDGAQWRGQQAAGTDLIQACQRYGVAGMDKAYKEDMRSLAYTKTDHTPEEIALLQDYCIEDCRMTMRLFRRCGRVSIFCARRYAVPS